MTAWRYHYTNKHMTHLNQAWVGSHITQWGKATKVKRLNQANLNTESAKVTGENNALPVLMRLALPLFTNGADI